MYCIIVKEIVGSIISTYEKKTQDGSWIGRREMLLVDYIMCSDGKEIINRLPYYFMLVAY